MASADRLIEVFNEAKTRSAGAERDHFLSEACRNEPQLKEQVLSLLEAHEGAGDFLKYTQAIPPVTLLTEKPGDRIGRYKLLEQIGEGGCGVVYMAEQEEPVRRRVALKVIKLGMDTKQVIARFEAERQALALMDHPNIAKVLDGGATDTGRPYFVMELVRGIKITDYCDQNNLSTRERLELFIQVCQAVQHAHQKGIIHRDIKPSNILVTQHDDVAVPKVIDFGIAKATIGHLTDKTVFTAFAQFMGTPAYMSPEQAQMSGLDIDTRADIYSLGVLVYELLTGNTPFDAKALLAAGMDEMRRKIREDEPAKPSTCLSTMLAMDLTTVARHRHVEPPKLIHLIRGDLDWLVMKCLEKDRTRRYETANALAMDLQRHLNDEPVAACPPSRSYRFQKLVRRNRLAFAAASAITAALVLGLGISTWMFVKEKQARQRAVVAEQEQSRLRLQAEANEKKAASEAAKSQQVAQFMKDMLNGVGPSVAMGRDTTMLREIVDKTAERIGTDLKGHPEVEIELRHTLAVIYFELQLYEKMEGTAQEMLRLARAYFGEENLFVADALVEVGRALAYLRLIDESESYLRRAIAMQRKLRGNDSLQEASALVDLGNTLRMKAVLSEHKEEKNILAEAEIAIRSGLRIHKKRLGNDGSQVVWVLHTLSILLQIEKKWTEAETAAREALAIARKINGDEHPDTAWQYKALGEVLALGSTDKLDEAETYLRKALKIQERTQGKGKMGQSYVHRDLAISLQKQGKLDDAEIHFRESLAIVRKEMGADYLDLPENLTYLASILRQNSKLAEARTLAEEAVAISQRHPDRVARWMQVRAFRTLRAVQDDEAAAAKKTSAAKP
jgi:serine/threonine protein kinase/tetratricopeptide (TPR) repeat protein